MENNFITRLKQEMSDLDVKLFNLHTFLARDDAFDKVGEYQYNMMHMQLDSMRIYSGILYLRLKDLEENEN